jgi:hypothetical protein
VNKANCKCIFNGSWEEIMLGSQLEETQSPLTLLCQWIITAWLQISQKVTAKVLKKWFISKAVDNMLWNVNKGIENSSSECEKDDCTVQHCKQLR